MNKPFTKIAACLFALGAIIHLLRLITHFSVQIGGVLMPLWVNVIGVILATTFAVMLWRESAK
jgi:hypothetical protein